MSNTLEIKPNSSIDKIEKKPKSKKGGKREGSGRKPMAGKKELVDLKTQLEAHASELVDIQMGEKVIKMTRLLALMNILFTEGFKNKNIQAIKEYLDRTLGKARQPIEGVENGKPIIIQFDQEFNASTSRKTTSGNSK